MSHSYTSRNNINRNNDEFKFFSSSLFKNYKDFNNVTWFNFNTNVNELDLLGLLV